MKGKNYREDELPDLDQQLESLPDESGYHDQKKKAEGKSRNRDERMANRRKGRCGSQKTDSRSERNTGRKKRSQ